MIELVYAPIFTRQFNKLPKNIQEEVLEKIEVFKNPAQHQYLKVHKLHGKFRNFYSFSVNYKYRIIFNFATKDEVNILAVGDHDVYD